MRTLKDLGPSPEHAKYQSLMPQFWKRVKQQEDNDIARGLPAQGRTEFAQEWFDAWAEQDIKKIDYCLAEECSYIDSTTFQENRPGRQFTIDNCQSAFDMFPDFAFYPQDGEIRSLPYWDYFEDQWRVTIPWRGIGRMIGETIEPNTGAKLKGTGRCLNFIGIDRYTLTEDFKISHIDTDWDMLYGVLQLAGLGPLAKKRSLQKFGLRASGLVVPAFRALTLLTTR